jgi:thymidylate synthase (FAD)
MIELNVINPSAQLIDIKKIIENRIANEGDKNYTNCYYVIEHVGRVCYNSYNDDNTQDDMIKFLQGGAERGHRSMFEFGQLRFLYECDKREMSQLYNFLFDNRTYIDVKFANKLESSAVIITGSPRALIELLENLTIEEHNPCHSFYVCLYNALMSIVPVIVTSWETVTSLNSYYSLIYNSELNENHYTIQDITADFANRSDFTKFLFLIQCDRSVSHELVRHRPVSFLQASQRFIRYNDKNPYLICLGKGQCKDKAYLKTVKSQARIAFKKYTELLARKVKPENARVVLPNCTETKVFVYSSKEEMRHFFRMRQSKFAYSPIKEAFDMAYQQLIDKKYI